MFNINLLHRSFLEKRKTEIKPGFVLNDVHLIKQDEYFRPKDDQNHMKIDEINHINWEIIGAIDMDKMLKDIFNILNSKFILHETKSVANHFESDNIFWDHYRSHLSPHSQDKLNRDHGILNKVAKPNVLLNVMIIEGFLVFNHAILLDLCNIKFHLHVPYEICYERRQQRCYDPPDVPLYFEVSLEFVESMINFLNRNF